MIKRARPQIPPPAIPLAEALATLDGSLERLQKVGMMVIGGSGSSLHTLDFIVMAAVKRSLSLASGIGAMIRAQNMVCSRALLRMHLDTVSRFLAYTYVNDPEMVAKGVTGGTHLKKFKSIEGKPLTDFYLIERMSKDHPWVVTVYERTSGYVHFSEQQFFDSIHTLGTDEERTMGLQISHIDSKYPEFSWAEVASFFNKLTEILIAVLTAYAVSKRAPQSTPN